MSNIQAAAVAQIALEMPSEDSQPYTVRAVLEALNKAYRAGFDDAIAVLAVAEAQRKVA